MQDRDLHNPPSNDDTNEFLSEHPAQEPFASEAAPESRLDSESKPEPAARHQPPPHEPALRDEPAPRYEPDEQPPGYGPASHHGQRPGEPAWRSEPSPLLHSEPLIDPRFEAPAAPVLFPPPESRSTSGPKLVAAALLIAAVGASGYFLFRTRGTVTPPPLVGEVAPSAPTDSVSPLGADAPPIDLPPLDESDDVVRGLVKELTSHPTVAAWLATDGLVRSFTVVVTNIAGGQPTATQAAALRPRGNFRVDERGEEWYIDARSYARYLPLATAASSIDPEGAAKLYTMLKPRIEDAFRELGMPGTFDATLERALVVLLQTPRPQGRIAVEPNGPVVYRFADPALEKLTPAQKLLIRFGPENQRTVQDSLRDIALALGIPEERLP